MSEPESPPIDRVESCHEHDHPAAYGKLGWKPDAGISRKLKSTFGL